MVESVSGTSDLNPEIEIEADELLEDSAEHVLPSPAASLVPVDALHELHARGEIELIDAPEPSAAVADENPPTVPAEVVGPIATALVPSDVLEELHARGEIDLFDADGNLVEPPQQIADELLEVIDEEVAPSGAEAVGQAPSGEASATILEALARTPVFAELQEAERVGLHAGASRRSVADRSFVFREGEAAGSWFLLLDGALEVLRHTQQGEVVLQQLRAGEIFGMFGLLAGRKRAASVRAIGQAELVAFDPEPLEKLRESSPAARRAVDKFFTERLLENFLGASPLFADLSAVARGLLISQFRERRVKPNERVVSPGEVFNGLFLVLDGRLVISKRQSAAREEELALLDRGEFFGVVSALSGTPCQVTVLAEKETTVAMLPQKAFNDFIKDYPLLRQLPARLAEQGMLVDRDVFVGRLGIPGLG